MLDLAAANLSSPPVLFFMLGFAGALSGSKLTLPEAVAKALSVYLMLSIGFKGGAALAVHGLEAGLMLALLSGVVLSAAIPLIAFGFVSVMDPSLPQKDRAAVAAHYGSISIVTFLAAGEALKAAGLHSEGYLVAVAAVMETPAILVALWLARRGADKPKEGSGELLREVFLNSSVVILTGAFIIGLISGEKGLSDISAFIVDPFKGVLCLFLLDMGAVAGAGIKRGWRSMRPGLIAFGLLMPYVSAFLAIPFALASGLSAGGTAVFMTLAASASYIAVPAAMRLALPEARPAIYLTLSLGVTFPMNLIVGIPVYGAIAQWLH